MLVPVRNLRRFILPLAIFVVVGIFITLSHDQPFNVQSTKPGHWQPSTFVLNETTAPLESVSASTPVPPLPANSSVDTSFTARIINASELLNRPIATRLGSVPRIFHQSWINNELPKKFQSWSEGCRRKHPDYEWVLWTNDDNLALVTKYFPWMLDAYNSLRSDIYRADLARNMYMYIFGGIYADLDTDCLQNSNVIFDNTSIPHIPAHEVYNGVDYKPNRTAYFARMGIDREFEHSIPNAWMASTPGHPFFLLPLESVLEIQGNNKEWRKFPEYITGPVALRNAIIKYIRKYKFRTHPGAIDKGLKARIEAGPFSPVDGKTNHTVKLLHQDLIFPYSWNKDGRQHANICWVLSGEFDADKCKEALDVVGKSSVAVTYWSHTHSPSGHDDGNMKHVDDRTDGGH